MGNHRPDLCMTPDLVAFLGLLLLLMWVSYDE